MSKNEASAATEELGGSVATPYESDETVMAYFGKKQRFKRNFGLWSMCGLTLSTMVTWEAVIVGGGPSLVNGGPTGSFIAFIIGWIGTILQTLVMAEMASMIPLSGGQYNWVAVLAPPKVKKFLSYMTGWLILITWNGAAAVSLFETASIIESCAVLSYGYEPQRWQTGLISWGSLFLSLFINIFASFAIPRLEIGALFCHLLGFFPIFIVILVGTQPKNDSSEVFSLFVDGGNWGSMGLATLVGLASMLTSFLGMDTAAHVAEEVQDAHRTLPRAMIISALLSGAQGLAMLIAFLYCLGPIEDALASVAQGTFPIVDVLARATKSNSASSGLSIIILVPFLFGCLGAVTAASRTMFAFARENGLPGSRYLAWVPESRPVPVISILAVFLIQIILSTIGIGSTAALQAFFGLCINSLYSVFIIAGSVMLYVRLTDPTLLYGPFRLGRYGVPITISALLFSLVGFFFAFWPSAVDPDQSTFNWGIVVYLGASLIAIVYWLASARKHYTGPIIERNLVVRATTESIKR